MKRKTSCRPSLLRDNLNDMSRVKFFSRTNCVRRRIPELIDYILKFIFKVHNLCTGTKTKQLDNCHQEFYVPNVSRMFGSGFFSGLRLYFILQTNTS